MDSNPLTKLAIQILTGLANLLFAITVMMLIFCPKTQLWPTAQHWAFLITAHCTLEVVLILLTSYAAFFLGNIETADHSKSHKAVSILLVAWLLSGAFFPLFTVAALCMAVVVPDSAEATNRTTLLVILSATLLTSYLAIYLINDLKDSLPGFGMIKRRLSSSGDPVTAQEEIVLADQSNDANTLRGIINQQKSTIFAQQQEIQQLKLQLQQFQAADINEVSTSGDIQMQVFA